MAIIANDNSNPGKTGFVEAFITIIRDQFPPFFVNEPYRVTLDERTAIASSVYTVTAQDNDLLVSLIFFVIQTSLKLFSSPGQIPGRAIVLPPALALAAALAKSLMLK